MTQRSNNLPAVSQNPGDPAPSSMDKHSPQVHNLRRTLLHSGLLRSCVGFSVLALSSCFIQGNSIGDESSDKKVTDPRVVSDTKSDIASLDETETRIEDAILDLDDDLEQTSPWQERSFAGHSQYTISMQGDIEFIRAETEGQASVLYRQTRIDLRETPVISWRWKVANIYRDINEKEKSGDDYPARLYVVVQTGLLPWETLAINYVWSSTGRQGDSWNNAFTDKAKMLALRAGPEQVGQWQQEQRNVVDDFKTFFDLDIDQLDGYAIMIDGDNSGQSGLSWLSNIEFLAESAR